MSETRVASSVTMSDRTGARPEGPASFSSPATWVVAVLAVLLGGAIIASSAEGLAIGQRDAPSYLSSAESLEAGVGYRTPYGDPGKAVDFDNTTSPVVDFPPGYPALLSVGVMLGADAESTARVVGALLVVAIVFAVYATTRALPRFRSAAGGAALAALIAATLTLPYTTTVATEPLYGLILVLTLAATAAFAHTKRPIPLIVATVLAAVATNVRNGGLALVATVAFVAWLALKGSRWRWLTPLAVLVAGVAPLYLSTALGTRVLAWHPPDSGPLKELANGVAEWFVPPVGSPVVRVAVFVILLAALLSWARPWRGGEGEAVAKWSLLPVLVGLIAAGAHLGLLFVTKIFFSAQLSLGSRQLYPIGLALLLASVQYLNRRPRTDGNRRTWLSFAILGLCCVVATGWVAIGALTGLASGMRAFNSTEFKESDPVEFLVSTIPGELVFSNIPEGLWVAGLSDVRPIPTLFDPLSLADNALLDAEMDQLADEIEGGAMVFYNLDGRPYMVELDDLEAMAPCTVVADDSSVVLASPGNPACPEQ